MISSAAMKAGTGMNVAAARVVTGCDSVHRSELRRCWAK